MTEPIHMIKYTGHVTPDPIKTVLCTKLILPNNLSSKLFGCSTYWADVTCGDCLKIHERRLKNKNYSRARVSHTKEFLKMKRVFYLRNKDRGWKIPQIKREWKMFAEYYVAVRK